MTLKEEILAACAKRCTLTPLLVDEWGIEVYIKALTAKAVLSMQDSTELPYSCRLISVCVCDEAGAQLFTPSEVENLSGEAFTQLFLACSKSGDLSKEAIEKKETN